MALSTSAQTRQIVTSAKPISAAKRRRAKLRKELWPDVTDEMIWNRATFKGFTTVPRTMPIIMSIINTLSKTSAGNVYFGIWCKAFDDFIIEVRDEYDMAFSCGYSGSRAIRSWRERVDVLEKNGFVRSSRSPVGSYRYILVLDPHKAIAKLYGHSAVEKEYYAALQQTLITIGAV